MNYRKMNFRFAALFVLTLLFAGMLAAPASAVTFTTTKDCKDLQNDGIQFTAPAAIAPENAAKWRGNIQVVVWSSDPLEAYNEADPIGSSATAYSAGKSVVKEVTLYAASSGTAYQCQQLLSGGKTNTFSCNSFPSGATIGRISVRFLPKFDATDRLITGDYRISFQDIIPATIMQLEKGTANVDIYASACAWNMIPQPFLPQAPAASIVYNTKDNPAACGGGGVQTLQFVENGGSPFTIVSFPLADAPDAARFRIIVQPKIDQYSYFMELHFVDNKNTDLKMTYEYIRGANPRDVQATAGNEAVWNDAELPIRLVSGTIQIKDPVAMHLMPSRTDFTITVYYQNKDKKLGYENSMFHFIRDLSIQFAPSCGASMKYRTSPSAFDPCLSSKQTFAIDFRDGSGDGYALETVGPLSLAENGAPNPPFPFPSFSDKKERNVYFWTNKCTDATCKYWGESDAYTYRVEVSDPGSGNRGWHYNYAGGGVLTQIPMAVYQDATKFRVNTVFLTARSAGTYRVCGFIPPNSRGGYDPNKPYKCAMEFFVTIPEKGGDSSCKSSAQDGIYRAVWTGCKVDHEPQILEFNSPKEQYSFISNYSNKRLTYELDPGLSTMPMALDLRELFCDWQSLAEGYGTGGAVCSPSKIELPPYTRAIIKGGKFHLPQKPPFYNQEDKYEFILSYNRLDTTSNANLFIKTVYKECPREKIPDTGYSLRSPAPSAAEQTSDIIFTNNSLRIPAIGLGMETPIPIVHVSYVDGDLKNGWNLKMLGGYIGELEGGAYLPYPGNSVLTGHFYSQGVFVNLKYVKLEDEIIIFGSDNMKYIYKVTNSYWAQNDDIYQMFQPNGEKSLTLVTCDGYNFITDTYDKRYIVQATLVSEEPMQP